MRAIVSAATKKPRARAAITGLGFSAMSRQPIGTIRELAGSAIAAAAADAGLRLKEIDGLLLNKSPTAATDELPLRLRNDLGIRDLALLAALDSEGSTAVQMVQYAALAVDAGLAKSVVCVFADTPLKGKGGGDTFAMAMPLSGIESWEARQGFFGASAGYALAARRHMALFGTTHEQLGAYAIACRQWAALNPQAFLRKPLTMADYLASPFVVEPFRVLDCCFPVNGAIALVVTSVERAADAPRPATYIHGMGQGHRGRSGLRGDEAEVDTGATQAGETAYRSAGAKASDVTQAQFYDAFSYVGLLSLEAYGLCRRGASGAFVARGHTAPGGKLPVNTGGGHLSAFYLQGVTPLSEAVIQARGAGGERQVDNELILVSGNGGCLDYHACLLVSPKKRLN
jgi:acetyl-CoA acetyltransferase